MTHDSADAYTVITHMEKYFGRIVHGFRNPDVDKATLGVVEFPIQEEQGAVVYATLGVSHRRRRRNDGSFGRQEFIMLIDPADERRNLLPGILQQVADSGDEAETTLGIGHVLGPWGPLVPGSTMTALCAVKPVYFPDELAEMTWQGDPLLITWLVPLSSTEADFIDHYGWRPFEQLLAEENPNLVDFNREPLLSFTEHD